MNKKYWFKAKNYGWGWYPSSWQGWIVIAIFIVAEIYMFCSIDSHSHSVSDTLINFVPNSIVFILILVLICYIKGEHPSWRWGNKRKT